jgi:hypothetical protein
MAVSAAFHRTIIRREQPAMRSISFKCCSKATDSDLGRSYNTSLPSGGSHGAMQ